MKLSELSEKARERAINDYRYSSVYYDFDWWETIYERVIEDLKSIGFVNVDISGSDEFKLAWSGRWDGGTDVKDEEVWRIEALPELEGLLSVLRQQQALFGTWEPGSCLTVWVDTSGGVSAEVDWFGGDYMIGYPPDELYTTERIEEAITAFNDEVLRCLAAEQDYISSDEYIVYMLEDEEFDEDGATHHQTKMVHVP